MAGPNDKKPDDMMDDPELKAAMGNRLKHAAHVPNEQFNPPKSNMPKQPGTPAAAQQAAGSQPKFEQQGGTGKGQAPPFPVVDRMDLGRYQEVKQSDADTFGLEKHQHFDEELNELALKEVAAERGISVDELLRQKADRQAEVKLQTARAEAAKIDQEQIRPPSSFTSAEDEEILALEARLNEAKQRKVNQTINPAQPIETAADLTRRLEAKAKRQVKKKAVKEREDNKLGVPKEMHDNPVIERLRKKLSLDDMKAAKVTIEGIKFEMLPPSSSLSMWILEKIQTGQELAGDGAPLALTLKLATISAAITKIEGVPIRKVLSIPEVEEAEELAVLLLCAQTLWEMFVGLPSRNDLFRFNPDLGIKLYEVFKAEFGDKELESSFQEDIHRYTCLVKECLEMYDMREPHSQLNPFCKIHGTPMEDKGLVRELRAIPLA